MPLQPSNEKLLFLVSNENLIEDMRTLKGRSLKRMDIDMSGNFAKGALSSLVIRGLHLKKRLRILRSKFFPFVEDFFLKGLIVEESKHVKMAEKATKYLERF